MVKTMTRARLSKGAAEPSRPWALVAGASGGLGRAIAVALASDGWNLALNYRSNLVAAEETGRRVAEMGARWRLYQTDLTDIAQVKTMVQAVTSESALAGVVYAAGPHIPMDFISRTTPEKFAGSIDGDLKAAYNLIQLSLPAVRASSGNIVAVVTPVIDRYSKMDILSSAPKAALQAVIRGIAAEEGRFGVRANCIGVGMIEGEGLWNALHANGDFTQDGLDLLRRQTPLGHFGEVGDIAEAARFLMSSRAKWITGHTLTVDGGYSL